MFMGKKYVKMAIGFIWLFVLLLTPFSIEGSPAGPLFSSAYVYVSAGMLVGVLLAACTRGLFGTAFRAKAHCVSGVLGLTLTVVLVAPEFVSFLFPAAAQDNLFISIESAYSTFVSVHHLSLMLMGVFLCLFFSEMFASRVMETSDSACEKNAPGISMSVVVMAASCFVIGVCRPGAWLPFVASDYCASDLAFPMLIYGFVIAIAGIALVRLGEIEERGNSAVVLLIASFSLGQIAWNIVARCSDTVACAQALSFPMFVAILVACAATLLSVVFASKLDSFCHRIGYPCGEPQDMVSLKTSRNECLDAFGLAAREHEAVLLLLAGYTSFESAERMGVHPSTVRNYLQRAYRKIGVEDSKELLARYSSSVPERSDAGKGAGSFDEKTQKLCSVTVVSFILVACLLVSPHAFEGGAAALRFDRASVLGFGLGLLSFGTMNFIVSRCICSNLILWELNGLVSKALSGVSSVVLILLVAGYSTVFSSLIPGFTLWNGSTMALCCALVVIILCARARGFLRAYGDAICFPGKVGAYAFFVLLVVMTSSASILVWLAVLLVAVVAFSVSSWVLLNAKCIDQIKWESKDTQEAGIGAVVYMAAIGFFLGVDWALQVDMLTCVLEWLFLASFFLLCARLIIDVVGRKAFIAIALGCAVSIVFRCQMAFAIALVAFFVCRMMRDSSWEYVPSQFLETASLGLGGGMVIGRITIDRLFDYVATNGGLSVVDTWFAFTPQISTPIIALVFVLAGSLCLAWIVLVSSQDPPEDCAIEVQEKRRLFMASQGLNAREVEVLVLISRGMTGSQIAQKIHYSYGAVNAARAAGYRKLGVHSKRELVDLLRRSV